MSYLVTIDGGVATGKTEVAKAVANELHYFFLSTGKMYRIVAWYAIKAGVLGQDKKVVKNLKKINIEFKNNQLLFDGKDEDLLEEDISIAASSIAQIPQVRNFLNKIQLKITKNINFVIEGRDGGTKVFPNADIKFFLTANVEVSSRRRYEQLKESGLINVSYEDIKESLIARDNHDKNRKLAPVIPAKKAIIIDTSELSVEQVKEIIINKILEQQSAENEK